MAELSCPICHNTEGHKMDCQNADYVRNKNKRIEELEAENRIFRSTESVSDSTWDALLEQVRQLQTKLARVEWQPIETAPKDGTKILLWNKHRSRQTGSLFARNDGIMITFGCVTAHEIIFKEPPTHWMPLPEPPINREGDDE